ncbi:MAG TPA: calcium-binding protein [Solirubrobacterales bacterium]|nr:calcium-binding protein [Solirubrobacterales bacterium]
MAPAALAGAIVLALTMTGAAAPAVDPFVEYCAYRSAGPPGPAGNRLVVKGASVYVSRQKAAIMVSYWGPDCSGPQATVDNIDRIVVCADGEGVQIDQGVGGSFGPGATPERHGSEIEIAVEGDHVELFGTRGPDQIEIRTLPGDHVALNTDRRRDGVRPDYDLIVSGPIPRVLRVRGYKGNDRIDARRLTGMGDARLRRVIRLFGDAGDDVILGSPGGEWRLKDGPGDDLVFAGPGDDSVDLNRGHDRVYGGPGHDALFYSTYERFGGRPPDASDRLFGGRGDDVISDHNEHPDQVHCGPGFDKLDTEPHDRLRDSDCERRLTG